LNYGNNILVYNYLCNINVLIKSLIATLNRRRYTGKRSAKCLLLNGAIVRNTTQIGSGWNTPSVRNGAQI